MEVLYTGYLIKSPAQPALTKNTVRIILQFNLKLKYLQSVKDSSSVRETKQFYLSLTEIMEASFLVLSKTDEDSYQLIYNASNEIKKIDLSK